MFESLYMNTLFIIEIDILESGRNAFVTPLKRKSLCTIYGKSIMIIVTFLLKRVFIIFIGYQT